MTRLTFRIAVLFVFGVLSFEAQSPHAQAGSAPALTGFPFTDEDLNYSLNWPTGINLGEAHLHAKHSGSNWNFSLTVDGGIPGFQVKDIYHAESTGDFCSTSFDRSTSHGSRATDETETIDTGRRDASRVTKGGGGHTDIGVPDCIKDALTYLFYAREELGQGRVPVSQQILFGGLYQISLVYGGAPIIPIGAKQVQSDEILCTVKGASSEFKFEVYFARDPARSPLLIKAPFAMGTFSMELIR